MIRKLALAVLFMLGGLPLSVYGIGLGDMKTYSALNQNFKGEIRLLSVPRGELDTLRVKLASREAFAKVGSEYMHILNRLKFEAVRRKDGSAVIMVTSNEVIREPFLDFLVEVNWPNGRLVREYTVLLDPPLTTRRRPPEISRSRIASKKKATTTPAAPVSRTSPQAKPQPRADGLYGPVIANETAWKIAQKLKPEGVSIHQTMMALLQNNPQAFVGNNVNLLKKDSMLKVPSIEEIEALGGQDAVASFERQTDDWQANVAKKTPAPATGESSPDADAPVPQATEEQPVAVEEEARLQIAAASMKDTGEAGAGEADAAPRDGEEDLRHELMLARENMETSRLEAEELKATVGEMGNQLEEMKRLLTLQDEQLAQLRARMALLAGDPALLEDEPQGALLTETRVEPGSDLEQDPATSETAAINETETAQDAAEEAVADAAVGGTDAEEIAVQEEPLALETSTTAVAPVEPRSSETAADPVEPETAAAEEPAQEVADNSSQTSWLEDNLPTVAAAAGGLFAVGVLAALVRGRKKKALTGGVLQTHDVKLASMPETEPEPEPEPVIGSLAEVDQEEAPATGGYASTYEPVFGQDDSEVDTLAAADVYIAYSRYDEAQKTLEEEIAGGDRGVPIRHKLLEVYFATDNVQNFVELADSMVKDGQDKEDPEAWEHIRTMGKKLDKFNPLFWSPDSSTVTAEESDLSLDIHGGTEDQDNKESLGGLESLDLDMASYGVQDDSELDGAVPGATEVETGLDAELTDLGELENVTQIKAKESTNESDDEIRFAEPLQDMELGDDMDTKLDLARAYMEMGDDEAAESILKEVLEKGSGEQMVAASELRSRLAS